MKVNLLIDGNYLTNKGIFALKGQNTMYLDLPVLLRNDLDKILGEYAYDKVFLFSDRPKYWRKEFYPEYKTGRKYDDEIDWEHVHNVYDDFVSDVIQMPRVKHLGIQGAEADDLIAYTVKRSNAAGYSNVIVAADSDLHQILDFSTVDGYINILHNYKFSDMRSYWPREYKVFVDWLAGQGGDVFDMGDEKDFLDFVYTTLNNTIVKEVDPEMTLFCKAIGGDPKDTVSSCLVTYTKTGKPRGIGASGAETIYKLYKENYPEPIDFSTSTFRTRAAEVVAMSRKIELDDHDKLRNIELLIERNLHIKELDHRHLPEDIRQRLK